MNTLSCLNQSLAFQEEMIQFTYSASEGLHKTPKIFTEINLIKVKPNNKKIFSLEIFHCLHSTKTVETDESSHTILVKFIINNSHIT